MCLGIWTSFFVRRLKWESFQIFNLLDKSDIFIRVNHGQDETIEEEILRKFLKQKTLIDFCRFQALPGKESLTTPERHPTLRWRACVLLHSVCGSSKKYSNFTMFLMHRIQFSSASLLFRHLNNDNPFRVFCDNFFRCQVSLSFVNQHDYKWNFHKNYTSFPLRNKL